MSNLPVASLDTLAQYLVNDYWTVPPPQATGSLYRPGSADPPHHFDHANITYSFAGLTGPMAQTHRDMIAQALKVWSDAANITFTEVASGGDLYFSNQSSEVEAYSTPTYVTNAQGDMHYVSSAVVFSDGFLTEYLGNGLNNYDFSSYVHEIGHSLGLGHQGPYNYIVKIKYQPTYAVDAIFANDTRQMSVMSYFDQSNFGSASDTFALTPQMADILAIQSIYGAAITRTGDTVYGPNGNAGPVFSAGFTPGTKGLAAMTIVDSGGIDTIDVSSYASNQGIDLRPGHFSSVGGQSGNLGIWIGTVIENATGGSGADTLIGNDVNNVLRGGAGNDWLQGGKGNDTLEGGTGDDKLDGGPGIDTATYANEGFFLVVDLLKGTNTGPAGGADTLIDIENLIGSAYMDTLLGDNGANMLDGGNGDDTLDGRGGADVLLGGIGIDEATYADSPGGVWVDLQSLEGHGADAEGDLLIGIEWLTGSASGDQLYGDGQDNRLDGGDGKDLLAGRGGYDTLIGGIGDDTYELHDVTLVRLTGPTGLSYNDTVFDRVIEDAGGGIDDTVRIEAATSSGGVTVKGYTLPANVENGVVVGTAAFDLAGNAGLNLLQGNSAANRLQGLDGDDTLYGGGGDDRLEGGIGSDTLSGDLGNDTLSGGANADRFTYHAGDGNDIVTDFSPTEGDRIDVRDVPGVHGLADLKLSASGTGTLVSIAGGSLLLQNIGPGQIGAGQFIFNQAPTAITLSNSHVLESSANGTVVGKLGAIDSDPADSFSFALLDNAGGRFAINAGQLVVAGALDYELSPSQVVRVRVTDAGGNTFDSNLTIAVDNVIETLYGSSGNDRFSLEPGDWTDRVAAGAGNDQVSIAAGVGSVVVDAGPGNDVITGNGQTILSFGSTPGPVNFNLGAGAGLRMAVMKDLGTGVVTPLQTRSGALNPQDFGGSDNPVFSPDGKKVAFQSTAQLDPAQGGGMWNIWVKDLANGSTTLVSSTATGAMGNNNSLTSDYRPAWSPDGTRIAFTSSATNFVSGDSNGLADIFVKTVAGPDAGRIDRVSLGNGGVQATDSTLASTSVPHGSFGAQFSPDGRSLLFWSSADNLVAGDTNGQADVFLRVLSGANAGSTYCLSRNASGQIGNGQSLDASFSPDGSKVVFKSTAANLGASGNSLFVKDISALASGADPSNGALTKVAAQGFWPSFSPDGSHLLYANGQVYSLDLKTMAASVVSTDAAGTAGNGVSQQPAWSADGQSVSFLSTASNLVAGDTNGAIDIFVKTVAGPQAGSIVRASVDATGTQANGNSGLPGFSPTQPKLVVFETDANNLYVPGSAVGNDKFSGVDGVWGSSANDILLNSNTALSFATFRGEAGSDVLQGNTVTQDEADYRDSPAAVSVTMTNDPAYPGYGSAKDGWGGSDTLRWIDQVQGSNYGDTIRMDGLSNLVRGNGGDDVIEGRGGNDLIDGGAGTDTAVFSGRVGDYQFSAGGTLLGQTTTWQVHDMRTGSPDGTDGLVDIERLQFSDGSFDQAQLLAWLSAHGGLVGLPAPLASDGLHALP